MFCPQAALDTLEAKLPYKLWQHQRDAYSYAWNKRTLGHGALWDMFMGAGKTPNTAVFLASIPTNRPHLIIGPLNSFDTWRKHLVHLFGPEEVHIYHGSDRDNSVNVQKLCAARVILTTYGLIRTHASAKGLISGDVASEKKPPVNLCMIPFDSIVMDEVQEIKNGLGSGARGKATKIGSAVYGLIRETKAEFVLALTGTPVDNRIMELGAIAVALASCGGRDPSRLSFGNRQTWATLSKEHDDGSAEMARIATIRHLTSQFSFHVGRGDAVNMPSLPPLIETTVPVDMSKRQLQITAELFNEGKKIAAGYAGMASQEKFSARSRLLSILLKMRQVCDAPWLIDKGPAIVDDSPKLKDAVEKLRKAVVDDGESVLVFVNWLEIQSNIVDLIREAIPGQEPLVYNGSTSDSERQVVLDLFMGSDPHHRVLVSTLKAGNSSLNLFKASKVIILGPWYSTGPERQAVCRAHRQGQTRPVTAWRYLTSGKTAETWIRGIQMRKTKNVVHAVNADTDLSTYDWEGDKPTFQEVLDFFDTGAETARQALLQVQAQAQAKVQALLQAQAHAKVQPQPTPAVTTTASLASTAQPLVRTAASLGSTAQPLVRPSASFGFTAQPMVRQAASLASTVQPFRPAASLASTFQPLARAAVPVTSIRPVTPHQQSRAVIPPQQPQTRVPVITSTPSRSANIHTLSSPHTAGLIRPSVKFLTTSQHRDAIKASRPRQSEHVLRLKKTLAKQQEERRRQFVAQQRSAHPVYHRP
jgi:hypothetical protein